MRGVPSGGQEGREGGAFRGSEGGAFRESGGSGGGRLQGVRRVVRGAPSGGQYGDVGIHFSAPSIASSHPVTIMMTMIATVISSN